VANLDLSPELEDILAAHCVENESTRKAVIEAALIVYFERFGWRFSVQDGQLTVVPPPAQAAWRQWETRRRGPVLMRLDKACRPCKLEPHEVVALGLSVQK